MLNTTNPYDIHEHQHRFAVWTAGRASQVKGKRFPVKTCSEWLSNAGIGRSLTLAELPASADEFDEKHRDWRETLVSLARPTVDLSHGQAAKILNIYFKTRFVNSETAQHPSVVYLHPPIDRLLIEEIKKRAELDQPTQKRLKNATRNGWSAMDSEKYEEVIAIFRALISPKPFWMLEDYWCGFQG